MSEEFETTIKTIAEHFPYPPTPPLRRPTPQLRPRLRWQRVALALVFVAVSSLMIPDIRAAVLTFLQIGAVRIDLEGTSETGEPLHLEDVSGETTLDEAQALVTFPLLLAPDDPPNRVFVQGSLVIFVWISEGRIERALYQISGFDWMVMKSASSKILSSPRVNGRSGLWVELSHPVQFLKDGVVQPELTHFVTGPVLIWEVGQVTYRLETHESLEDAVRFAESLVEMPE